jgi:uncharacterized membrane protein
MEEASRIQALEDRLAAIEIHLGLGKLSAPEPLAPAQIDEALKTPSPPAPAPLQPAPIVPPPEAPILPPAQSPADIPFAAVNSESEPLAENEMSADGDVSGEPEVGQSKDERRRVQLKFIRRVRAYFRKREAHLRQRQPLFPLQLPSPSSATAKPLFVSPFPARSARSPETLERTIGLKWSGWIGAVVLVIGAAMGVQFAWQNHWFGMISPGLRLAMIFAVGAALLAAGEVVLRRVHQVPAASLFGAGVAVLFLGSYAGYAYFDLYGRSTSLYLMAAATLAGAAVAMRGNLVSIAVLSLIGANLAPVMVGTPDAPVLPFLFYLLMMLLVALTLAAWGRGGKWWILRGCSLCPTIFWMWTILNGPHAQESSVLGFLCAFGLLYHAELIVTTVRTARRSEQQASGAPLAAIGTTFAICVTAAVAFGGLKYLEHATDFQRTAFALLLSAISAALGFGLPRLHASLKKLGYSHRATAAGLLVLAMPLYYGGVRLEAAWMLLGLAFAGSWRWTGSRVARIAAPLVWGLGLWKLIITTLYATGFGIEGPLGATWFTILSTPIGSTTILAWCFALSGQCIAAAITSGEDPSFWKPGALLLSMLCTLVWLSGSIHGLPHLGATFAIIGYAWVMCLLADPFGHLEFGASATGSLFVAAAKWAVIDTLAARLSPHWTETRPVFNSLTAMGVLTAGSFLGFHRVSRGSIWKVGRRREVIDRIPLHAMSVVVTVIAIALLTIGLSFEIDRMVLRALLAGWSDSLPAWQVRQLSFTVLWSIAIAAVATAALKPPAPGMAVTSKRFIWVLVALLAAKYIFIDTLLAYTDPEPLTSVRLAPVPPIWNLEVLACVAIVACIGWSQWIAQRAGAALVDNDGWGIGVIVALLTAWIGTLEIDRFIGSSVMVHDPLGIAWHLKQLGWTIWWTMVTGSTLLICRRLDKSRNPGAIWITLYPSVLALLVVKYITVDVLYWRQSQSPPAGWMVLLNWDVCAGVVVGIGAWLPRWIAKSPAIEASPIRIAFDKMAVLSLVALLLFVGTLEVDRAFSTAALRQTLHDAALAEQVALSIFWSVFAVTMLAAGFWKRDAALRYIGLGLLAITLLKVVVLDLSHVRYGYRVLSFLGLGMVLLITSVMYGKISPRLLQQTEAKLDA